MFSPIRSLALIWTALAAILVMEAMYRRRPRPARRKAPDRPVSEEVAALRPRRPRPYDELRLTNL